MDSEDRVALERDAGFYTEAFYQTLFNLAHAHRFDVRLCRDVEEEVYLERAVQDYEYQWCETGDKAVDRWKRHKAVVMMSNMAVEWALLHNKDDMGWNAVYFNVMYRESTRRLWARLCLYIVEDPLK